MTDQELSFNRVFYGCRLIDGGFVWASSMHDIMNYPTRAIDQPIEKSCWGDVKKLLALSASNGSKHAHDSLP